MLLNMHLTFVKLKKKGQESAIMEQFLPKVLTSNYSSKCHLNTFPHSAGCNSSNSGNSKVPWVSHQDREHHLTGEGADPTSCILQYDHIKVNIFDRQIPQLVDSRGRDIYERESGWKRNNHLCVSGTCASLQGAVGMACWLIETDPLKLRANWKSVSLSPGLTGVLQLKETIAVWN